MPAMKNKILTIVVIIVMVIGCNTVAAPDGIDTTHGILKDYTGLDGCGWVIELADGTKLEPTNLNEFELIPTDGLPIDFTYTQFEGGSICMVGQVVKIDMIISR